MHPTIKNLLFSLAWLISAACISCKKNDGFSHNSGQPIAISSFSPATGPIGTEILIKGSNFSSDTSQVKVSINGIALLVVGVKGDEIMAVVTEKTGTGPV